MVSVDSGETTTVLCEGCKDRQTECRCQFVAPIGGSEIAWLAGPDNTCDNHDVFVESLWWDRDGSLNVVFEVDTDVRYLTVAP